MLCDTLQAVGAGLEDVHMIPFLPVTSQAVAPCALVVLVISYQ